MFLFIMLILMLQNSLLAGVFCPLCETDAPSFAPAGEVLRQNARCYVCESRERHRHLWYFLTEHHPEFFSTPLTLLHCAPEVPCVVNNCACIATLEQILLPIKSWQERPQRKNIDVLKVDLPDNTVDVIFCYHVLTHIVDEAGSLRELRRVLNPTGWALFMVPIHYDLETTYENPAITSREERCKHFGQSDHVRKYGRDFKQRLEAAGFKVEVFYLKDLPKDIRSAYGLDGYDDHPEFNAARGADIFIGRK